MARKRSDLSRLAERVAKNVKSIPDSEIDFSDIPETTEEEFNRARRVGRPVTGNAKMLIALRISPTVLVRLRSQAAKQKKPYQTYIHEILERAANKSAA
ncbi:MAG TPA: BrnA antitoxin family protein [Candidatus Acidoferrum sp.]|jgi:predicted DNA binding CopG/RHH family protein